MSPYRGFLGVGVSVADGELSTMHVLQTSRCLADVIDEVEQGAGGRQSAHRAINVTEKLRCVLSPLDEFVCLFPELEPALQVLLSLMTVEKKSYNSCRNSTRRIRPQLPGQLQSEVCYLPLDLFVMSLLQFVESQVDETLTAQQQTLQFVINLTRSDSLLMVGGGSEPHHILDQFECVVQHGDNSVQISRVGFH